MLNNGYAPADLWHHDGCNTAMQKKSYAPAAKQKVYPYICHGKLTHNHNKEEMLHHRIQLNTLPTYRFIIPLRSAG